MDKLTHRGAGFGAGSKAARGTAAVVIAGLLWGCIGPLMVEMENAGATTQVIAFLRIAIAALALGAFTVARCGLKAFRVDARTLAFCALLGIACHGAYNACYVIAVEGVGVAASSVLLRIAPVFTLMIGIILATERSTAVKVAGIAVDIVGCALVIAGGQTASVGLSVAGIAFGVGAAALYSLNPLLSKAADRKANPLVVTTYSFLFGTAALALWLQPWNGTLVVNPTILGYGAVLALVPTALAYLLYYAGAGMLDESSKLPVLSSLETPVAALLGVALYGEQLGLAGFAGIVLVLASVVLLSRPTSHRTAHSHRPHRAHGGRSGVPVAQRLANVREGDVRAA